MKKIIRIILGLGILAAIAVLMAGIMLGGNFDVLNPQGVIADKQRNLLVFVVCLSLIVIIPVFTLLAVFSWKYRAGNKKARYRPDWDHNHWLEVIWWGIPCAIILVLAIVTWVTSHTLDPYRPLDTDKKPVEVQVVALQWKWLFIYPDLGVASVNELPMPSQTPIHFTITADAPMNSFWIPSLGGQIYAMSGMSTQLSLMAHNEGTYKGSSANISGEGFADMTFNAVSMSEAKFASWVDSTKQSEESLTRQSYDELAKPGTAKVTYYKLDEPRLYDAIIMKYMMPDESTRKNGMGVRHSAPEAAR